MAFKLLYVDIFINIIYSKLLWKQLITIRCFIELHFIIYPINLDLNEINSWVHMKTIRHSKFE